MVIIHCCVRWEFEPILEFDGFIFEKYNHTLKNLFCISCNPLQLPYNYIIVLYI